MTVEKSFSENKIFLERKKFVDTFLLFIHVCQTSNKKSGFVAFKRTVAVKNLIQVKIILI